MRMKKLLTFLTLLTLFFTTAGAETVTYSLTPDNASTGLDDEVYINVLTEFTYSDVSWKMKYWNPNSLQVKTNKNDAKDEFRFYNTSAFPGRITQVVITFSALNVTDASKLMFIGGSSEVSETTGGTAGTWDSNAKTLTWTPGASDNFTFFGFYQNGKAASGNNYLAESDAIVVTYEVGSTPVTPRVETPVITLSQDAPYYVGDNVTASITCGTEGAAILYQINDGSWTNYTAGSNITIPTTTAGTVTIKAKATKADYTDSGEATKTITISPAPTTYNHLADVNSDECTTGTEFTFTAQTVVLGKYNKNLYIVMPNNSAGTLIYGDSNWGDGYTFGKVVSSNWSGKKAIFNDKPEVTNVSNFELASTEVEVTPIVITSDADLTKLNFGRYAVIKNVQVDENGSFSGLTTYNQFHPDLTDFAAGRYDVYGVIGWNKGNNDSEGKGQFMPLKYVEHEASYTITVTQPTAGGTISADAETADEGDEITLTATPAAGYEFASWIVKDADNNDIAVTENKFNMPASNVTVTATFSKIKYTISTAVSTTAAGNAGCAVWMKDGFETINNAATSTVGTTVEFALHPVNNWMIDPSNAPTVTFGEGQSVAVTAGATDNEGATHYTFTMPASDVTITGHFVPYAPDVYFLEGDLSNWDNGKKMTYNSADKTYSIRVYFSDEYGFFRFRAGDNTYASGAEGEWWPISENGEGESHFGDNITLYKGSSKRFRVPAGIYDIKVGQVFDDPTASNNPNWWGETTVTVTKVEPTLTFNPAAGEVPNNQVVTVSSNLYELLSAINSDVVENDVTNMVKTDGEYAANVTLTADATVTGRAKYGYIEKTATAKYTISQENTNTQYKLIKSADDLVNGKKYLVVGTYPSDSKTFVMGAYSEPRLSAVDATPENDIIEATADMRIVTLEAVGTNWALKTDDGYVYTNSTTTNGCAAYVANQEPAVIEFESETSGELNIKFVNNNDKGYLTPQRFGNSSNYYYGFGGYASATSVNASHLFLYRQVEEVVTLKVETPVITPGTGTYAEAKDVEITCSTPGATIWYKYGNMTDYAEYTEALTISENTTLSAYATKDGYNDSDVATATYTFSELSDEIFTLVTSEDQLIEGNEYIIVAATDTYKPALGAIESRNGTPANGYTFETAGDYSVLTLAAESDVNIFTLGKVEVTDPNDKFYWTFKDKDGNFLYADVSGGAIDTDNQSNYSHVYKINIGEGTHYNNYATIQGSANYQIEYRTDDEIFRHYACSNVNQTGNVYKKVLLYTRGVQQTPIMTLADICKYGVTTEGKNEYIIADKLQAVYAYTKGGNSLLWCKDLDNKSIVPTTIHSGQIDFMRSEAINYDTEEGVHNGQQGPWDQSNWIVLQFTNPTGSNNIDQMLQNAQDKFIKPGTIKGKLVDDVNYILKVDLDQLDLVTQADPDYDEEPYNENVYCPANFLPENLNIDDGIENGDGAETGNQNYFFMNPKVQEICYITYAQWDDYGYFAVPSSSNFSSGIDGAFQVGWVYQDKPALDPGKIYKFHAVVHRVGKEYGPQNPVSTKDGMPVYENITVLPIDLTASSEVVTAINTVETGNGEVKSVKYVNVAGMVSDVPFQGVNIVVTEYSDGSRSTSKMLRK